jgi:RNA-directed DNA polymerase
VPLVARTTRQDKVRELQRTLYRAAKADPKRRFHALYDKVLRRDVLERAWELVRVNRGAAGIDQQTIADVEEYGIAQLLDELAADLRDDSYRSLPARRVFIPKPGRPDEQRPLSIPTVIAYCCVVQRASGFVGGHASVPSVVRAAARGPVCAS